MRDQAERLRQIIDDIKVNQLKNQANLINTVKKRNAKVITVTSGKGGVGKTNVTINLAVMLSDMGYRVVILDADFGLANIDILFGIVPKYTLYDVISGNKNILEVLCEGPKEIKFVSGGSGMEELVKLNKNQLEQFVNNISLLDKICDIILIDTGAGLSDKVISFVMASDEVILVTTPEPTSITDAYALTKMISNRDKSKIIKVIVNRAENAKEANDILNKLSIVTSKFLSYKLYPLGYILQDDAVIRSVKTQQPFTLSFPKSNAARLIKDIAKKLVDVEETINQKENSGVRGFVSKLTSLLYR